MPSQQSPPFAWRSRSSIWFITFVVGFSQAIDALAYGIIIPVVPFQLQKLGYENVSSKTGWLLCTYSISLIFTTFPVSYLSERYKARRWPLYIGLVALVVSQVLFMEAKAYWMMVLSRVLQGLSTTVVGVVSLALLCDTVPEEKLGQQLGMSMAGLTAGLVIAPPIGGVLYGRLGYRAPFIFSIAACAVDLVCRILIIEKAEADQIRARLDESDGEKEVAPAQKSEEVEKARATTSEATAATLDITTQPPRPHLTPWEILKRLGLSRRLVTVSVVTVTIGMFATGLEPTLPLRAQAVWQLDATRVGIVFIGATAPSVLSSIIAGWLSDRLSPSIVIVGSIALTMPWLYPLALHGHLSAFVLSLVAASFFNFGVFSPIAAEYASLTNEIDGVGYADSFGLFNIACAVGTLVGPVIAGNVYDNVKNGWVVQCAIMAGVLLVGMLVGTMVGEKPLFSLIRKRIRSIGTTETTAV